MTAIEDRTSARGGWLAQLARVPTTAWLILAVLVATGCALYSRLSTLGPILGDTDDATRLVEIREWLAGKSWYDLTSDRFGLADGLTSHWSRLIDAAIGFLITGFGWFMPANEAELAARIVWPMLLLVPLFGLIAQGAHWQGGRLAGRLSLALAATSITTLAQFAPGRIDHHNVMIVAAVGAVLLSARAFAAPGRAGAAGALAGLGLAIGYEGLVLTAALVACLALIAVIRADQARVAASMVSAMAIVLALALAATVPPGRWLASNCDALSLNLVLMVAVGAVALRLMAGERLAHDPPARIAVLALGAAAALGVYVAAEPACLAGPFGHLDAVVRTGWLERVRETSSIGRIVMTEPLIGIPALIYMAAAVTAQIANWREAPRDAGRIVMTAMLAIACILACWQVKLLPYATALCCVPLAVAVAGLRGSARISAATVRFSVLAFLNLTTLFEATGAVLRIGRQVTGVPPTAAAEAAERCDDGRLLKGLAALDPGTVVAPIDLGPFIVAFTPHRVLAAPYHRLGAALRLQITIWEGRDLTKVEQLLREAGASYVVACAASGSDETERRADFEARLLSGEIPAFLEPVILYGTGPLKVFRLRSGDS